VKLLDSLLDAIVRLEGDALVMHVGEKPYVVTASSSMNAYRGPLAWGQVELSSRVLTFDAVSSMLGQILPADQQQALTEFGAIEHEIPSPAGVADRFTVVAARGGEDVWVELRRRPIELEQAAAAVAAPEPTVASEVQTPPPAEEPHHAATAVAEPPSVSPTVESAAPEVPVEASPTIEDTPAASHAAPAEEEAEAAEPAADVEIQRIEIVPDVAEEPAAHVAFDSNSSIVVAMPGDDAQEIALDAVPDNAIQIIEDEAQGVPTEEEVDAMLAATAGAILTSGMGEVVEDRAGTDDEATAVEDIDEDENEIVLDVDMTSAPAMVQTEVAPEPAAEASPTTEPAFELSPPPQDSAPVEAESVEQETPAEPVPGTPLFSEEAMLAAAAPVAETLPAEAVPEEPAVTESIASPELAVATTPPVASEEVAAASDVHATPEPELRAVDLESSNQPAEPVALEQQVSPEHPTVSAQPLALPDTEPSEEPVATEQLEQPQSAWPQATESPVAGDVLGIEVEPQPAIESPQAEPEPPAWIPATPITWSPPQDIPLSAPDAWTPPQHSWLPALPAHFEPAPFEASANEPTADAQIPLQVAPTAHEVPAPEETPDFAAVVPMFESVEADAAAVDSATPQDESKRIADSIAPPAIEESATLHAPESTAPFVRESAEVPEPSASAYTMSQSAEPATSEPTPHVEAPSVSEMTMEVTPELRRQESPVHMAAEATASMGASAPSAHELVHGDASTRADDESRHGVVVPLGRAASKPEAVVPYTPSEDAALMHTLRAAAARGASTVYVVAQSKPMIRIDGEIGPLESEPMLTASDVERLVQELAPPRRRDALQNGPVEWLCDVPEIGRVRCLTFRDHRGPGVLFRMIPPRAISADQLGLTPEVQALCQQSDGLVIVTGARASGKSTLLNSFIDLINRTRSDHVITIESQIGFVHESRKSFISQRETRGDADLAATYARAALREDPDVMMVEDLKSSDLVAAALEAAESGRLVLASVPAASTIGALERLIEVFPADRRTKARTMLAGALRGVIAQVLLRRVTGGRVPAREILLNTPAVSQIVLEGKMFQLPVALDSGRRHGMVPLTDSLAVHVRDGSVSVAEAYRKALDRAALVALLKREGFDTSFAERLA
jgi:twitching motility protein PilT